MDDGFVEWKFFVSKLERMWRETFDDGQRQMGMNGDELSCNSEFATTGWPIKEGVQNLSASGVLSNDRRQGGMEAE